MNPAEQHAAQQRLAEGLGAALAHLNAHFPGFATFVAVVAPAATTRNGCAFLSNDLTAARPALADMLAHADAPDVARFAVVAADLSSRTRGPVS